MWKKKNGQTVQMYGQNLNEIKLQMAEPKVTFFF